MNSRFTSGFRIAALTVAVTVFTSTLAFAQTPQSKSIADAAQRPTLMNAKAFARLAQPRTLEAATAVAAEGRPSLFQQSRWAMELQATTPTTAPQRSWVSRHKILIGVLAGIGGFLTFAAICAAGACDG